MSRTLRRALLPVVAVLALVGVGLTTAPAPTTSATADSATQGQGLDPRGPNVTPETVNLDGKIQRVATACRSLKYPDGAYMVEFCYEYAAGGIPGKWYSGWRGMTNIAYPAGHTDTMRYCIYGFQHCTGYAPDGDDWGDGWSYSINNADTMWVEFDVLYGSTWYCRRAFGNNVGSIAFTTCP